ncbi:type II toxin-antitoxin system HicA family toxin [Candidatus Saganbacteria bacterium]|uniref:Type II toxin-antitoxin system HicA family toxin n=1 Tax=Candidatus Saganbacteria bacterium TaxID=2575572 RepID=A0A9D6YVP1_UNCSA|nr:type II toxin-antitoxin system HicA family toxin [Candidatus Saganbacteria bacterium]
MPIIKDRELIRALHKLGFFEHRERGTSHLVFRHADGRTAVVSRHPGKDIPRGTLRGILRDINTSIEEFITALK